MTTSTTVLLWSCFGGGVGHTCCCGCCYVFPLCELAESVGGRREVQEGKGEKGEVSTQSAVILFVPFIFLQSIRSKRLSDEQDARSLTSSLCYWLGACL